MIHSFNLGKCILLKNTEKHNMILVKQVAFSLIGFVQNVNPAFCLNITTTFNINKDTSQRFIRFLSNHALKSQVDAYVLGKYVFDNLFIRG